MNLFQRLTEMAERMSPRKLFAVCAAIAIIVFAIIYMLLSSLLESPAGAQQASVTAVVEAAQDIPANTVITDDMVKTVNVNPEAMPKGAFTDVRAAIGKTVSVPMQEGDVLTARKVSARGPSGFLGLIPPGMRAISFSVNDVTAVSGFAKPGDKVDILLTSDKVNEDNITTKMVLRDVLLLAVNKTSMNSPAAQANASGTPAVVTVALTPYDAAKLLASAQLGQLQLMLRPFGASDVDSGAYYVIPLPQAQANLQAQSAGDTQAAAYAAPAYTPSSTGSAPAAPAYSNSPVVSTPSAASGSFGVEVIRGTTSSRGY